MPIHDARKVKSCATRPGVIRAERVALGILKTAEYRNAFVLFVRRAEGVSAPRETVPRRAHALRSPNATPHYFVWQPMQLWASLSVCFALSHSLARSAYFVFGSDLITALSCSLDFAKSPMRR